MALITRFIEDLGAPSAYIDRQFEGGPEAFVRCIEESSTLYVGNLSFYTSEEQIYTLFSKCGQIKRIIMGLDRNQKTPCGFCFVEYYLRNDALACKRYFDGMKLDERYIRVDLDPGFREGRQFGRGRRGGQVRDELRKGYDAGRGGWGGMDADVADGYRRPDRHYNDDHQTTKRGRHG